MNSKSDNQYKCKLCGKICNEEEISEEHYPARNTGNEDIVKLDILKMFDTLQSEETHDKIISRLKDGESFDEIAGDIFDKELSEPLYPDGRTAKTLCRDCNTFLGKYDEAYLKFFNAYGDPKIIKGFQPNTKFQIIKAIYAKFLSVPEAKDEVFDFIDFVKDSKSTSYSGKWFLYFVKRDFSTDLLGFNDIGTGKATYDEGVVYELSDDKFIYNLMNFPKHTCYEMTNIFDILNKKYILVEGVGESGGYHGSIFMCRMFSSELENEKAGKERHGD